MASINKQISIEYLDNTYDVKITMCLIDKIEDSMNLMAFLNRLNSGDVRLSHAAKLFALILTHAGAKDATQERVYTEMVGGGGLDPNEVVKVCNLVMLAMFPQVEEEQPKKKPVARRKTK